LGLIFARDIVNNTKNAVVVLVGRSPLSKAGQEVLDRLTVHGANIQYKQFDVTDRSMVFELIKGIKEDFGGINGIIHSAGLIRDRLIFNKSGDEVAEVLAPKVTGLVNLDCACADMELDFFILFSSTAGSLGNTGQADYAAANAFMDAYSVYRNAMVSSGERKGKTLSINWPLWKDGGMHVDRETEEVLRRSAGLVPMQTGTGLTALYNGIASGKDRIMVLEGELSKIHRVLENAESEPHSDKAGIKAVQINSSELKEKTLYKLKSLLDEITGMGIERIDAEEPLENYGIDSIMIMRLNSKLDGIFKGLSKTVFYEHTDLAGLAEYLVNDYTMECAAWTGLDNVPTLSAEISDDLSDSKVKLTKKGSFGTGARRKRHGSITKGIKKEREPIAIIGISGRYPKSRNMNEFWENFKSGKDCITEIPPERWSLEGFYNPDPDEAAAQGKSYSKWGGFIDGFSEFDPLFFNISPREAVNIDPQERLFIESCWEVLEDAGYTREQLKAQYKGRLEFLQE
jgi:polyketide synthase PksN